MPRRIIFAAASTVCPITSRPWSYGALEVALAYEPPATLAESFGPPLSRWQRANQLSEESWPELLEPAVGAVALDGRPAGDPRPAELCEG